VSWPGFARGESHDVVWSSLKRPGMWMATVRFSVSKTRNAGLLAGWGQHNWQHRTARDEIF